MCTNIIWSCWMEMYALTCPNTWSNTLYTLHRLQTIDAAHYWMNIAKCKIKTILFCYKFRAERFISLKPHSSIKSSVLFSGISAIMNGNYILSTRDNMMQDFLRLHFVKYEYSFLHDLHYWLPVKFIIWCAAYHFPWHQSGQLFQSFAKELCCVLNMKEHRLTSCLRYQVLPLPYCIVSYFHKVALQKRGKWHFVFIPIVYTKHYSEILTFQ